VFGFEGMAMAIITTHNVTLNDGDLVLRPLDDGHFPLLYRWNAHPVILEIDGSDDPEEVREIYAKCSAAGYAFLIEFQGVAVGECLLAKRTIGNGETGWGIDILIGEVEYWGRGIGTNAIKILVNFAFDKGIAKEIYAAISEDNLASQKTFEKVGFVFAHEENSILYFKISS